MEEDLFEGAGEQQGNTRKVSPNYPPQLKPWMFNPGVSGNPSGRPKGTVSLKEYAKQMLRDMTDSEKKEFMKGLSKDIVWKMAEGQWQQDVTSGGERIIPMPIIPLNKDALPTNNLNQQNSQPN